MAYGEVLAAIADPTRRQILEALRREPKTVGELAKDQPVSRPAVSQHLKVLASAGLVGVEPQGNCRLYRIKRDGLDDLRAYLDSYGSESEPPIEGPRAEEGDRLRRPAKHHWE